MSKKRRMRKSATQTGAPSQNAWLARQYGFKPVGRNAFQGKRRWQEPSYWAVETWFDIPTGRRKQYRTMVDAEMQLSRWAKQSWRDNRANARILWRGEIQNDQGTALKTFNFDDFEEYFD